MPVRTAYAGAAVSGEVLTAANVNKLPGGWIGHNEITATQTGITAEAALTNYSVAVTVGTSRRIRITVLVRVTSASATNISVFIKEGATYLAQSTTNVGASQVETMMFSAVITPTAGAHTYNATMSAGASSDANAGTAQPSFILVEDLGPAT